MIVSLLRKIPGKAKRIVDGFSRSARFGRKNGNITIISNNCIAGYLYKDLGTSYNSPTVGLQFTQDGFVRFCRDFDKYIRLPIAAHPSPSESEFRELGGEKIDFPVGILGDITLFLQHYGTVEEAAEAWRRRTARIDRSKLFFIFMVHDKTNSSVIRDFQSLPLYNTLALTFSDRRDDAPNTSPLLCREDQWFSVDPNSGDPYYRRFDFISWIEGCNNSKKAGRKAR